MTATFSYPIRESIIQDGVCDCCDGSDEEVFGIDSELSQIRKTLITKKLHNSANCSTSCFALYKQLKPYFIRLTNEVSSAYDRKKRIQQITNRLPRILEDTIQHSHSNLKQIRELRTFLQVLLKRELLYQNIERIRRGKWIAARERKWRIPPNLDVKSNRKVNITLLSEQEWANATFSSSDDVLLATFALIVNNTVDKGETKSTVLRRKPRDEIAETQVLRPFMVSTENISKAVNLTIKHAELQNMVQNVIRMCRPRFISATKMWSCRRFALFEDTIERDESKPETQPSKYNVQRRRILNPRLSTEISSVWNAVFLLNGTIQLPAKRPLIRELFSNHVLSEERNIVEEEREEVPSRQLSIWIYLGELIGGNWIDIRKVLGLNYDSSRLGEVMYLNEMELSLRHSIKRLQSAESSDNGASHADYKRVESLLHENIRNSIIGRSSHTLEGVLSETVNTERLRDSTLFNSLIDDHHSVSIRLLVKWILKVIGLVITPVTIPVTMLLELSPVTTHFPLLTDPTSWISLPSFLHDIEIWISVRSSFRSLFPWNKISWAISEAVDVGPEILRRLFPPWHISHESDEVYVLKSLIDSLNNMEAKIIEEIYESNLTLMELGRLSGNGFEILAPLTTSANNMHLRYHYRPLREFSLKEAVYSSIGKGVPSYLENEVYLPSDGESAKSGSRIVGQGCSFEIFGDLFCHNKYMGTFLNYTEVNVANKEDRISKWLKELMYTIGPFHKDKSKVDLLSPRSIQKLDLHSFGILKAHDVLENKFGLYFHRNDSEADGSILGAEINFICGETQLSGMENSSDMISNFIAVVGQVNERKSQNTHRILLRSPLACTETHVRQIRHLSNLLSINVPK